MRESTLKVCFVLDCTASMEQWIEAAKQRINVILEELQHEHPNFKIYAAFIGYRDFGETYHYMKFTNDFEDIRYLLLDIDAKGGEDEAEDVSGAYRWVNSLNWSADVRSVFHITDSPDHGLLYHDHNVSDDYPEGHPTVDLLNEIQKLATSDINLTLFRINQSTDIMYNLMRSEYVLIRMDGFRIVEFMNSTQTVTDAFYDEISSQLHYSMCTYDTTRA